MVGEPGPLTSGWDELRGVGYMPELPAGLGGDQFS